MKILLIGAIILLVLVIIVQVKNKYTKNEKITANIISEQVKTNIEKEQIKPNIDFEIKDFATGNNDIKLISVRDIDRIRLLTEIRKEIGYGLVEIKYLIDSAPSILCKNIDYDSALAIKQKLEATGATISIENNNN